MKHCSNCRHCVIDRRAILMGHYVKMCRLDRRVILHPFFSGMRCNKYRKVRSERCK